MDVIHKSASGNPPVTAPQKEQVTNVLNPAQADALFKTIVIAYGLSRSALFFIVQSVIVGLLWNGAGIFLMDLVEAFKTKVDEAFKTKVDLNFVIDSYQFKLFSLFKNRSVHLVEHHGASVYEITDQQNTILLSKISARRVAPTIPDFSEEEKLGVKVSMKEFQKLKSLTQSPYPPYTILRLYDQQLISVQLPGLEPHIVEPAAYRETSGNPPDVSLKSFAITMMPGDEIEVSIFKKGGNYWMKTEAEIAIGVTVKFFEPVFVLNV